MDKTLAENKRIPLQELRRIQRSLNTNSSYPSEGSTAPARSSSRMPSIWGSDSKSSANKPTSSKKANTAKKASGGGSNKGPREFGCRQEAPVYGAVVTAENEGNSPLLITSAATLSREHGRKQPAAAVTPEVAAYRQAAAALCIKRLRSGLGKGSSSARCRDPRFSDLCGNLNLSSCSKAYAFIDEQQQQQQRMLQQVVRTGRLPTLQGEQFGNERVEKRKGRKATSEERQQAQRLLEQVKSQQQQRQRKAAAVALRAELSRKEREAIALTGKKVHYCSRKRFKQLLQQKQEQQRSAKGKVKAEIQKSKKLLANERRKNKVPTTRRALVT